MLNKLPLKQNIYTKTKTIGCPNDPTSNLLSLTPLDDNTQQLMHTSTQFTSFFRSVPTKKVVSADHTASMT